jgi:lipopolysaccharide export system permease protein
MKLLDKLVLKDLLPMFGFSIALFTSLWFAGGPILEAARNLVNIPVVLSLTFPMAVVLAVLNGYGRVSGDSEAVAVFAAGIPFVRAAAPAVVLGLIASLTGYFISDYLAIEANQQITHLKETALKQIESDKPIQIPPIMNGDRLQYTVLVGKITEAKAGLLQNVTVTFYDEHGVPSEVVFAKKARWKEGVQWVLYDAQVNGLGEHAAFLANPAIVVDFHTSPDALALIDTDTGTLSFAQLKKLTRAFKAGGFADKARKSELAMWRIVALPFASFVFAVIGAPLGLRPQRAAKGAGWGLAVLIIFGYYVLYMVTGSMSDGGSLPPLVAAFTPDIVGLIVGGVLIARAAT